MRSRSRWNEGICARRLEAALRIGRSLSYISRRKDLEDALEVAERALGGFR